MAILTDKYGATWPLEQLKAHARASATSQNVPPGGLVALLGAESNFDPQAESPAGAQGIAQFMPATAAEWGVDVWDPIDSISGAARYLAWLRSRTPSWPAAIAAYNWGIGNVQRNIEENGGLNVSAMPLETRNYVAKLAPAFGEPTAPAEQSPGISAGLIVAAVVALFVVASS